MQEPVFQISVTGFQFLKPGLLVGVNGLLDPVVTGEKLVYKCLVSFVSIMYFLGCILSPTMHQDFLKLS